MTRSHVAGWTSASPTPAQLAEFFSQIKAGRVTKDRLQAFLRGDLQPAGYDLAHEILGQDFITPEEIAFARNLSYGDEQLKQFVDTLPTEEEIRWCRDNNYMLVAGPPHPMSLLEMRDLQSTYFDLKSGGWYAEEREKFSRNDKAGTGWLMLRKDAVPGSTRKVWDEQLPLLSEEELVPNAAEVAWGIITYKTVRGVYLLPNVYVRTSSVDSGGGRVRVGGFDSKGLDVGGHWGDDRGGGLRVFSARKKKGS